MFNAGKLLKVTQCGYKLLSKSLILLTKFLLFILSPQTFTFYHFLNKTFQHIKNSMKLSVYFNMQNWGTNKKAMRSFFK